MIVKNLLAVGVIATTATVASAADQAKANWKVNGKIRVDAVQQSTEMKPQGGTKSTSKSSEIVLNRAQFTLTGEVGSDQMFIKYYADTNKLHDAYIAHKFADNIVANIGLMHVLTQSWEYDYDNTDQYLSSFAGAYAPDQSTGVQINAMFGEHTVSLQAVQGVKTASNAAGNFFGYKIVSSEPTQIDEYQLKSEELNNGGGLTAAVQYRGNIMNMIRPIVTYTSVKTAGSQVQGATPAGYSYSNGYQNQLGLGVQFETAGLVADLEYDTVKVLKKKYEGAEPTTGVLNKDADINSLVVQAKYAIGMTTPFVKLTSDSAKYGQEGNSGDITSMGLALGVEHKLDSVCRLHAVYMSRASEVKVTSSTKNKINNAGFNLGVTAAM